MVSSSLRPCIQSEPTRISKQADFARMLSRIASLITFGLKNAKSDWCSQWVPKNKALWISNSKDGIGIEIRLLSAGAQPQFGLRIFKNKQGKRIEVALRSLFGWSITSSSKSDFDDKMVPLTHRQYQDKQDRLRVLSKRSAHAQGESETPDWALMTDEAIVQFLYPNGIHRYLVPSKQQKRLSDLQALSQSRTKTERPCC